jgi:hypothetical protein
MGRLLGSLVLIAALVGVSACAQSTPSLVMRSHPSDQEARADLARLVELARSSDISAICEHGTLLCRNNADRAQATATVPSTAPLVVGSREVADSPLTEGGQSQGGRALKVCGLDGAGHAYGHEILFFGTAEDFTAIEALYWVIGFSESHVVGPTDASPGSEWSACPSGSGT